MTKKTFHLFTELGRRYGETGRFDNTVIRNLAPREKMGVGMRVFMRIGALFGMTNMYWNMMLKKHDAYDRRFARPFIEEK